MSDRPRHAIDRRSFCSLVAGAPLLLSAGPACGRPTPPDAAAARGERADVVEIDLRATTGAFDRLSGVQGSPLPLVAGEPDLTRLAREHQIERCRIDQDCAPNTLTLGGVFPDATADPDEPSSYHFAELDRHVAAARAAGAEVLWQASYDIGRTDRWVGPNLGGRAPADLDRWSRVVARCLEHLDVGWADGHRGAIAAVEFPNEPDGLGGFHGEDAARLAPTLQRFLETVERHRLSHPESRVLAVAPGIPLSIAEWPTWRPRFGAALTRLRASGRALPVFSFHTYGEDTSPTGNARLAAELRALLDEHGLRATALWNTEWLAGDHLRTHLGIDADRARAATRSELRAFAGGVAAYALACKLRWQGVVARSFYYRLNRRVFPPGHLPPYRDDGDGPGRFFSRSLRPGPLAQLERLTHEAARRTPLRCHTAYRDDGLLTALGLRSEDGRESAVLLSSLDRRARSLALRFAGSRLRAPPSARLLLPTAGAARPEERALAAPVPRGDRLDLPVTLPPLSAALLLLGAGA